MKNSIITISLVIAMVFGIMFVGGCSKKVTLYGPFGEKVVCREAKFFGETQNNYIQADWCDFKWTHCPDSFERLYDKLEDYKQVRLLDKATIDDANKECQEILARVYKRALEANCPDAANEIARVYTNDYAGNLENIDSIKLRNKGKFAMDYYPVFIAKKEISVKD